MRDQLTRLRPFLTIASVVVLGAWAASPAMATDPCLSDNPPPRCDREPPPPELEPALPVPTDLVATSVRATSVQLQWTDVSQSEDDNVVSYAGHEIHVGPQPPNTRVYVNVTGLSPAERYTGYRHHPREIQRLMFVATDPERWCQDGWVALVNDVT